MMFGKAKTGRLREGRSASGNDIESRCRERDASLGYQTRKAAVKRQPGVSLQQERTVGREGRPTPWVGVGRDERIHPRGALPDGALLHGWFEATSTEPISRAQTTVDDVVDAVDRSAGDAELTEPESQRS